MSLSLVCNTNVNAHIKEVLLNCTNGPNAFPLYPHTQCLYIVIFFVLPVVILTLIVYFDHDYLTLDHFNTRGRETNMMMGSFNFRHLNILGYMKNMTDEKSDYVETYFKY